MKDSLCAVPSESDGAVIGRDRLVGGWPPEAGRAESPGLSVAQAALACVPNRP